MSKQQTCPLMQKAIVVWLVPRVHAPAPARLPAPFGPSPRRARWCFSTGVPWRESAQHGSAKHAATLRAKPLRHARERAQARAKNA